MSQLGVVYRYVCYVWNLITNATDHMQSRYCGVSPL